MRKKRTNKFFISIILCIILIFTGLMLIGCGVDTSTTTITASSENKDEKLSFIADFYDNNGYNWLSVEGTSFNISPNKVKEYYYSDDGDWTYHYTMSSIMSIDIDGHNIESCGSTVIFADSRLEKYDINLPKFISSSESTESASISSPTDLSAEDYFTLGFWWKSKDLENRPTGARIIIVQSQNGDNICMYSGDNVSWDVPKNLPKTTEITIDEKPLFIHRANFAIIDVALLDKVVE